MDGVALLGESGHSPVNRVVRLVERATALPAVVPGVAKLAVREVRAGRLGCGLDHLDPVVRDLIGHEVTGPKNVGLDELGLRNERPRDAVLVVDHANFGQVAT